MKQVKLFFVALMTLVMGLTVTSCFDNDENTQVDNLPVIGKVKDSFVNLTFVSLDGFTVQSKNSVPLSSIYPNDYIVAVCSYDTELDVDQAKSTIQATIGHVEKISSDKLIGTTKAEDEGEHASYKSNRAVICIADFYLKPFMADQQNLLIPIQYFAHEKRDKHTFSLIYYTDESEMKDKKELTFYLRHTSTEEDKSETQKAFSYRVFNISSVINQFKALNNNKAPEKIVIVSENNEENNDLPTKTTSTQVNYEQK